MALRVGKDPLDYINEARAQKRQTMKRRFQEYKCSDCHVYVPSLAKTLLIAKNNMIAARVVDYDDYRDIADELNVRAVPTMIVFDKNWREVGRFVETPKKSGTVEEDICMIMESKKGDLKA